MYEKYTVHHTLATIHTYIAIHTVRVFVLPKNVPQKFSGFVPTFIHTTFKMLKIYPYF
jgi:hypothetical protein